MLSASFRHEQALAAIRSIIDGARPCDVESQMVDFKEEDGTVDRAGARREIDSHHEPAARALAADVACMANTHRGGVIIVGAQDRIAGPAAFVQTHLEAEWLRERIHALTQPHYAVEIDEYHHGGRRLHLIDVPPAMEEIRCAGHLRTRRGTDCVELTGDQAREFLEQRRGYDWTAEPSGMRVDACTPRALALARSHYAAQHGLAPGDNLELLRRMGILIEPATDDVPELSRAGALLLTPFEPAIEQIVLLITPAEGTPSRISRRGPAPLLELFAEIWETLTTMAFPSHAAVIGAQRVSVRTLPDIALREAIINAIMHRDYRRSRRPIVVHATGDPTDTLKVRSPGGLPPGVSRERLITTTSTPRNPALARAMRALGLAETEGVGIELMFRGMLRSGHQAPEIEEDLDEVVVLLHGGNPDHGLVTFFDTLSATNAGVDDVRATIAITELLHVPRIRPEQLAERAQCTTGEALTTLERLEAADAVERLVNRSRTFRLSESARTTLGRRIRHPIRRKSEEHLDLIAAFLDEEPEIGRAQAAELLGITPTSASRILGELRRSGKLATVANARGAGVRYRLVSPRGRRPTESGG